MKIYIHIYNCYLLKYILLFFVVVFFTLVWFGFFDLADLGTQSLLKITFTAT